MTLYLRGNEEKLKIDFDWKCLRLYKLEGVYTGKNDRQILSIMCISRVHQKIIFHYFEGNSTKITLKLLLARLLGEKLHLCAQLSQLCDQARKSPFVNKFISTYPTFECKITFLCPTCPTFRWKITFLFPTCPTFW